ncbi:MAG TPA: PDZ domain-containing protein [Rhizomicrobium sp.]|jgi:hypothetical protein|nr:PDZ domain-containing protein [Rhizomicrobium sp.]
MANAFTLALNPLRKRQTATDAAKGPGGSLAGLTAPMTVEAVIPPGLLQNFQTVFDYGAKTLTLAAPGTLTPQGVAVPIRVNPLTGFAMLDVDVDGKAYPTVIDNGGSYSAMRASATSEWTARHPAWLRSEGGVGESNLAMDGGVDVGVPVVKAQPAALGPLKLDELGVVTPGMSGAMGFVIGRTFRNYYSGKAGEEVNGWIGGNVMKSFRVTLDYPNRMSYWLQEVPLDTRDLDQVGITLVRWNGMTAIAGIAKKNGADAVAGAMPGDQIVSIDGRPTAAMTRGELLDALHGTPGEHRRLTLKRKGETVELDVPVTAF